MDKIVFTGGGTAGHIMPNIALIENLRGKFDIHYIGSQNGMERKIIEKMGISYHAIEVVKFKRSISPSNLLIPFKLMRAKSKARKILSELKPKLVFSKGGFVSLPVALAAKCPLICHESDISIGLANKLTLKKAKYLCCSFESTLKSYKNAIYTGLPIRNSLIKPKIGGEKPTLLIMGGSLGAKTINDCVAQSLDELLKHYQIIHITGKNKLNSSLNGKIGYTQMEFCANIADIYAQTDLCISRGGATALFELTALKIPSLIIPLKKASRGDQIENTSHFEKKGLVYALDEDKLNASALIDTLAALSRDERLKFNLNSEKNLNATQIISDLIINTAK